MNYLVVWTDNREGGPRSTALASARTGPCSIRTGFAISAAAGSGPAVAFDGTNYLVVWSNRRTFDHHGARVDPGGTVLDPGGITISTRPNVQFQPTLAFDGTNYLVVWIDARRREHRRLRRARVSVRDRARPGGDRDRERAGFNEVSPSVAFDGTNYLVVWEEDPCHRILGRRVSQGGVPDGDGSFLISYCQRPGKEPRGKVFIQKMDPAVAFDGVNYLVTWVYLYGDFSGYYTDIQGARVTPARGVLDRDLHHRGVGKPVLALGGLRRLDVSRRLGGARDPWDPRHGRRLRPRS